MRGQGETLKRGIVFEPHWENPVKAILDYFHLENACAIGISWGGYLALRAAAFEKRIAKAVAYDVLHDGFDCMTKPLPVPVKLILRFLFKCKARKVINTIITKAMGKSLILDWAVSHGQYITGTKCPYDFYEHLNDHTLRGITKSIDAGLPQKLMTNTSIGRIAGRKASRTWLAGKIKCGHCGAGLMCIVNPAKVTYFHCRKRVDSKSCIGCGTLRTMEVEASVYGEMYQKMTVFQTLTGGNPTKANPKLTALNVEHA